MSSYLYGVFIVPADGRPDHKDEVLRGIKLREMQAKWKEPRVLEIHYGPGMAEISRFRESWSDRNGNLSVEVRLVTPGGIRYKPIPSQRAHAKALSNHDISVVSYEMPEYIFRGAVWPSNTNPNFQIWIIVGRKELYYDIAPPPEFGMYEKDVTEDWNFEATETHDERITFVASRKDESRSVQVELPKKSKEYGFSALRNSSGEELLVFMNPSETIFDEGLFGYVYIRDEP
jgi:hypothetical protein